MCFSLPFKASVLLGWLGAYRGIHLPTPTPLDLGTWRAVPSSHLLDPTDVTAAAIMAGMALPCGASALVCAYHVLLGSLSEDSIIRSRTVIITLSSRPHHAYRIYLPPVRCTEH